MVQINKTYTHQTLREKSQWKGLVSMKIRDTPFLKITPLFYQTLPFHGKNLNPNFLTKVSKTQPLLYKGGGVPTMACDDVQISLT